MKNKIVMSLIALFCCALWGLSTPIVKLGYAYVDASHIPSLLLWVGIQFSIAGALIIAVSSILSKKLVFPKKKSIKGVFLIALFQTVLQYVALYIGLSYTTAVKGAVLKSIDVFFVMLVASLIFKQEKLTPKNIISCLIAFAGIIVMNLNGLELQINPLGDGLVVFAMLCYSFGPVLTKIFTQEEDPAVLCGYQMVLGGCVMLLIGVAFGGNVHVMRMLHIILGLSAIYAVSYVLWTILLKYHPASKVSIHSFMTPVFGVLLSFLLLQEDGGVALPNLLIALVLVSIGILLWGYQKKPKPLERHIQ